MDIDVITVSKFDKMCRTCLCVVNTETLASVFDVHYNEISFIEVLNICTTVQITAEDKLPMQICTECISNAIRSYNFKTKCEQSDIKLKQALDNYIDTVKVEYNEIYEQDIDSNSIESSIIANSNEEEIKSSVTEHKTIKGIPKGPPYECCSQKYDKFTEYILHRKEKKHPKDKKNHVCIYCKKLFSYHKLQLHLRSHTGEQPYKCEICPKRFSLAFNLKRHIMTHTGEKPYECKECGKKFVQSGSLADHMVLHTNETFICSCGKTLKNSSFRNHMRMHRMKNGQISNEVQRDHECSVCNRFFMTKSILKNHMLSHSDKTYLCNHCGKSFARRSELQTHIKTHTNDKPYSCSVCGRKFSQQGALKTHLLIHSGEKPFTCQLCGKSFTQPSHLKNHQRIHTGEKPYECSVCGKRFAINGNLTVHKRTHTGETPYVCLVCGKGFYDSSSMKKHKKGHGKIEVGDANDKNDVAGASTKPII